MMKLILTREVSGLGAPGDIVEVADGFGRNYLVPQGFAMKATKGAEKQIATIKRAREVREVRTLGEAKAIAAELAALTVTLPARAGETGKLFGSVTPADVVGAVKAAGGPAIDKRKVLLPAAIKSVGTHEVGVRIHPEVDATFSLEVVASK
jgi:large subunit ribosomal protein L9